MFVFKVAEGLLVYVGVNKYNVFESITVSEYTQGSEAKQFHWLSVATATSSDLTLS